MAGRPANGSRTRADPVVGMGEIGMFELLKASLRQRPEYILVGEVRGIEATVAFQAMATGHTVYSTMHADSARNRPALPEGEDAAGESVLSGLLHTLIDKGMSSDEVAAMRASRSPRAMRRVARVSRLTGSAMRSAIQ